MKYSYDQEEIPYYIPKTKFFDREEERELFQKIRFGDLDQREEAIDKIVSSNLRYVVSVAKNYFGKGISNNDLISHGNIGLLKAAERFDESRGHRFISYAKWWVRQSIQEAMVNELRTVRLPANKVMEILSLKSAVKELSQTLGRIPESYELAERLGVKEDKISTLRKLMTKNVSLDLSEESEDNTINYNNILTDDSYLPDESSEINQSNSFLEKALNSLSDREKFVLSSYYGLNGEEKTLNSIGQEISLSRERVRQIKDSALKKLRNKHSYLEDFIN